jgi:hypothetical protein
VLIGGVAGLAGVLILIGMGGRHPGRLHHLPATAVVIGVAVLLGYHLSLEAMIDRAALEYIWPVLACRRG